MLQGSQGPHQPGPLSPANARQLGLVDHRLSPSGTRRPRAGNAFAGGAEASSAPCNSGQDVLLPRHAVSPARCTCGVERTGRHRVMSVDGEVVFARAGFGPVAVGYPEAWDLQRMLHERRVDGDIPDCCLLLEHPSVYTAGKRTSPLDRPAGDPGVPVIDVDRGGKITWHGPRPLVGYPIVELGEPVHVIAYVPATPAAPIPACPELAAPTPP